MDAIKRGDMAAAAREIRERSNRTDDRGLQNRRNLETSLFQGSLNGFQSLVG